MSGGSGVATMVQGQIMSFRMAARAVVLVVGAGLALPALTIGASAAEQEHPPAQKWSFSGPLGKFDQGQLQRGLKVYREVCSNCHSLERIAFRNLAEQGGPGFTEEQAEAIAAEYQIKDGPNDSGDMFDRPGRLSDRFPSPFANEEAARSANGGAHPPDMSTLAKARTYERGFPQFVFDIFTQYQEQGQDYIHALLGGYEEAPADVKPPKDGLHYNKYFPGHWIGMAQPIEDGQVEYPDGTPTTVDQYGKDMAAFLSWAAEPHLMARKQMGLVVIFFLVVFAGLLYAVKKRVWHRWDDAHA